jgi:NAD(P)-dependent dehydrogenase (short-subunit alcohol dehydrogenase family)
MSEPKRVVLVTGGSRGIGLGIARRLAGDGCQIAINGRRPIEDVAKTLDALRRDGVDVLYCRADVAVASDRARMLDEVRGAFGRLDVLVNNAGVAPDRRADILDADEAGFDRLIEINLKGPYFLTQAAAKWMIAQRRADQRYRGCIVNIGSVSATVASVSRGDYCIAKAGIAMATRLWAARLAEFDIDVFEVRPGIIATDMTEGVKETYDHLIDATDLLVHKRWGTPDDVGRAVAMLARGELAYATGQVLHIDGGLTIQRL